MSQSIEKVDDTLLPEDLLTASDVVLSAIEDGYQWMSRRETKLHPDEKVATLVFTCHGERRLTHLTWSSVTRIHYLYAKLEKERKKGEEKAD